MVATDHYLVPVRQITQPRIKCSYRREWAATAAPILPSYSDVAGVAQDVAIGYIYPVMLAMRVRQEDKPRAI